MISRFTGGDVRFKFVPRTAAERGIVMGKSHKQAAAWTVYGKGILLALGIYLACQLLLALLLVKGVFPEGRSFPAVVVCCLLAAFAGGGFCARRSSFGALAGGALAAAGFAAVLLAVGLLCWEGISWTGRGGILLLCALGGGLLAGLMSGGKGRRVKRRKVHK